MRGVILGVCRVLTVVDCLLCVLGCCPYNRTRVCLSRRSRATNKQCSRYVATLLAWYPCLTSSKHHAVMYIRCLAWYPYLTSKLYHIVDLLSPLTCYPCLTSSKHHAVMYIRCLAWFPCLCKEHAPCSVHGGGWAWSDKAASAYRHEILVYSFWKETRDPPIKRLFNKYNQSRTPHSISLKIRCPR